MLIEEINRIKNLMFLSETKIPNKNIFHLFDISQFKQNPPPADNSDQTKEEIRFLKTINLEKKFVQRHDDIDGNFIDFLSNNNIDEKDIIKKINNDVRFIILELKNFYKRPRPFRIDDKLNDPFLKSMEGFAYPSGHSTQSNLLYLILSYKYPKFKSELKKIKDDIVYSRQMAKAHYPSDIKFGEKLAKSLFEFLKKNDLIH